MHHCCPAAACWTARRTRGPRGSSLAPTAPWGSPWRPSSSRLIQRQMWVAGNLVTLSDSRQLLTPSGSSGQCSLQTVGHVWGSRPRPEVLHLRRERVNHSDQHPGVAADLCCSLSACVHLQLGSSGWWWLHLRMLRFPVCDLQITQGHDGR